MVITIAEHACSDVLKRVLKAAEYIVCKHFLRNMNTAITYVKTKVYLENLKTCLQPWVCDPHDLYGDQALLL